MKRIILFLSMAMVVMQVATAQKKVLNAASSALDDGKLDEALKLVNQATENEETKILPKTWFVKGKILQSIALSTDAKYASQLHPRPRHASLAQKQKARCRAFFFVSRSITFKSAPTGCDRNGRNDFRVSNRRAVILWRMMRTAVSKLVIVLSTSRR